MSEAWKIAVVVIIITIFVSIVWPDFIFPKIKNIFFGKYPDTNIAIYGYEHSYFINELQKLAPKRSKITLKPLKFPEGIDNMEGKDIPFILEKWDYPKDSKLFYINVLNDGKSKDEDVVIYVSYPMNKTRIEKFEVVNNDENVKIIQGGSKGSSMVKFKIKELMPNTSQGIKIITKGKDLNDVKAWSGKEEKEIKKIFIFDVEIKPDIDYDGPSPLD